jgi:hypothetical protein
VITPNYNRVEYQRRFLVTGTPPAVASGITQIADRCISGTRVFLRKQVNANGSIERRLCKNYEAEGASCGAVAIEDLSAHDYALYEHMEAMLLSRRRTVIGPLAVDRFESALRGLVLCEIASANEAEVVAFVAPPWAPIDVTADPFFAPSALAFTTPDQLRARLQS